MAHHPLKTWLDSEPQENEGKRTYETLAARLSVTAESIRQVANGYRLPSWDLAFEIEALTGISAHELRDKSLYSHRGAA